MHRRAHKRLVISDSESDSVETTNTTTKPAQNDHSRVGVSDEHTTGLVYDVRMKFHRSIHNELDHPEDPRCLEKCLRIPAREATDEEIQLVHSKEHHEEVASISDLNYKDLKTTASQYNSIYLSNESGYCARLSCGGVIEMVDAVYTGKVRNGMAVVRPPGHHAEPDEPMGFCLYNNVAVAVRVLQKKHGVKKVLVLDWYVFTRNGIQKAFIDDPDVLYISIHRYEDANFYPYSTAAAHYVVGDGLGAGRTVNIPWPCAGMGDADYLYVMNHIVMPIAREFAPEIVIVAAGFDAAAGDDIGECFVTPTAFAHMTSLMKSLSGGKIVLAMEGGYSLDAIGVSALACFKILLGEDPPLSPPMVPSPRCIETAHRVVHIQSKYWESLQGSYLNAPRTQTQAVTTSPRQEFLTSHLKLVELPMDNPNLSDSKKCEVYYSPNIYRADALTIFIHDANATEQLSYDETSLVDIFNRYAETTRENAMELVDVNIPLMDTNESIDKNMVNSLVQYVWDQCVETSTAKRILFIATGAAVDGVCNLISKKAEEFLEVSRLFYFVMVPGLDAPSVKQSMAQWYYEHSYVLLHPVALEESQGEEFGNCHIYGVRTELPNTTLGRLHDQIWAQVNNYFAPRID
ncbi:Arginase/deacetylase [Basidiobolus meristosporus CBS 931.73]|uniref:histone deacetylase n=1 Tax=Basidiobolus meristosporus CBS 931.73 TaxID=1314790 RepID=A0A1Y1Z7R9_9FUNG|nr:Arginase/deacetylase [Basidiobolus meristosporus CBS 931.73]|eukprot:ORY06291.1 Arginase/deacetylase [Basidiobolus meristosporus CBS 931.73]